MKFLSIATIVLGMGGAAFAQEAQQLPTWVLDPQPVTGMRFPLGKVNPKGIEPRGKLSFPTYRGARTVETVRIPNAIVWFRIPFLERDFAVRTDPDVTKQ